MRRIHRDTISNKAPRLSVRIIIWTLAYYLLSGVNAICIQHVGLILHREIKQIVKIQPT